MPSQRSVRSDAFTREEWDLLVRLPTRVVVAATSAEADSPRRTVAEGLAGVAAIAAGRGSSSDLVRDIVTVIYAERDDGTPTAGEFTDRAAGLADVLRSCRAAAAVMAGRVSPAESGAYAAWLESIATRVAEASRSGGMLGFGGVQIGPAERRFLTDLADALRQPRS